jgi:hypothetical protein
VKGGGGLQGIRKGVNQILPGEGWSSGNRDVIPIEEEWSSGPSGRRIRWGGHQGDIGTSNTATGSNPNFAQLLDLSHERHQDTSFAWVIPGRHAGHSE